MGRSRFRRVPAYACSGVYPVVSTLAATCAPCQRASQTVPHPPWPILRSRTSSPPWRRGTAALPKRPALKLTDLEEDEPSEDEKITQSDAVGSLLSGYGCACALVRDSVVSSCSHRMGPSNVCFRRGERQACHRKSARRQQARMPVAARSALLPSGLLADALLLPMLELPLASKNGA
eukprot:1529024-Prymnesium_polylepis.1